MSLRTEIHHPSTARTCRQQNQRLPTSWPASCQSCKRFPSFAEAAVWPQSNWCRFFSILIAKSIDFELYSCWGSHFPQFSLISNHQKLRYYLSFWVAGDEGELWKSTDIKIYTYALTDILAGYEYFRQLSSFSSSNLNRQRFNPETRAFFRSMLPKLSVSYYTLSNKTMQILEGAWNRWHQGVKGIYEREALWGF